MAHCERLTFKSPSFPLFAKGEVRINSDEKTFGRKILAVLFEGGRYVCGSCAPV